MANVKVWNDNQFDYQEQFRDQLIKIKARSWIEMEEGEALLFKGSFAPIQVNADGKPIAKGFKMIRIEALSDEPAVTETKASLVCNACSYEASTDKDLAEHGKSEHADIMVRDEEAEREIATRKRRAKAS